MLAEFTVTPILLKEPIFPLLSPAEIRNKNKHVILSHKHVVLKREVLYRHEEKVLVGKSPLSLCLSHCFGYSVTYASSVLALLRLLDLGAVQE